MSYGNEIENLLKALAEAVKPFLGLPDEEDMLNPNDVEGMVETALEDIDLHDAVSDSLYRVLASSGHLEEAVKDLGLITESDLDDYISNEDVVTSYNISDCLDDYVQGSEVRDYVVEEVDSYFGEEKDTLRDMLIEVLLPEGTRTYDSNKYQLQRREVVEAMTGTEVTA